MDQEDTKLYQALGIDSTKQDVLSLSSKDIARAYRKSALKWHPDKNKDNPTAAAAKFSQLFIAYEKLSNPSIKNPYDDKIRAFRAQNVRRQHQGAERRKLRADLERRERVARAGAAEETVSLDDSTLERMRREINRLRKETNNAVPMPSHAFKASEGTSLKRREVAEVTLWNEVEGFLDFATAGKSTFEQFETAILDETFPNYNKTDKPSSPRQ